MAGQGVTRFVEVGAGKVLTGLVKRIAEQAEGLAVGTPDDVAAYRQALRRQLAIRPGRGHARRIEMFDLTGKTALVTGASGGIGGAIARALHAQGATVALSGTRREALDALAAELGSARTCSPPTSPTRTRSRRWSGGGSGASGRSTSWSTMPASPGQPASCA